VATAEGDPSLSPEERAARAAFELKVHGRQLTASEIEEKIRHVEEEYRGAGFSEEEIERRLAADRQLLIDRMRQEDDTANH
jgi:hypothetical protein